LELYGLGKHQLVELITTELATTVGYLYFRET